MLSGVAVGHDVTTYAHQTKDRRARRWWQRKPRRRQSDSTSDDPRPQHRHDESMGHSSYHQDIASGPLHSPLSPPPATARPSISVAERPKTLVLHHTPSLHPRTPTPDVPEGLLNTSGTADLRTAKRVESEGNDQIQSVAERGHCKLKVSDLPGSDARAELASRYRNESVAEQAQTPDRDSGVAASPLDQRFAAIQPLSAVNPDLLGLRSGLSGPDYHISQTPTKSTIVYIHHDSSLQSRTRSRANTPSTPSPVLDEPLSFPVPPGAISHQPVNVPSAGTSKFRVTDAMTTAATSATAGSPGFRSFPSTSPVRDDPMSFPGPSGAVRPAAVTGSAIPHQPVNVSAATSKFRVTDAVATSAAAGSPGYRSFPSTSSDERTLVRLNGGEGEQRRYVIAADALTAVDPSTAKPPPPKGDSDHAASKSVERKSDNLSSTSSSRPRVGGQFNVDSRQAVEPPPLHSADRRTPADRVVAPTKPKPAKKRDTRSTAVAREPANQRSKPTNQPLIQKHTPTNGKDKDNAKSAQRSKQSHIVAKQTENRLHGPVKLRQNNNKDSTLEQSMAEGSRPAKSVAEIRAMFQAQSQSHFA